MLLRLALFSALGLTVLSGLWRLFADPTAESAESALRSSKDLIAATQARTTEVLSWIVGQTPESIGTLMRDAKDDVTRSLDVDGTVLEAGPVAGVPAPMGSPRATELPATAPPPAGQSEPQEPGIDWYRR